MSEENGKMSTTSAVITMIRLCLGPGMLALPYAVSRGGLICAPIGLALVAIWNMYACYAMIKCKEVSKNSQYPPEVTSTYSRIAYSAVGWWGAFGTDFSVIVTLLGVCVTYQINFASLINVIPGVNWSTPVLICMSAFLLYPLACARDMSVLASMSSFGLTCIILNIMALFIFGYMSYGSGLLDGPDLRQESTHSVHTLLPFWPATTADLTVYAGVAIFCFGLCALAFPVEESMKEPREFLTAAGYCLFFVCVIYTIIGDGVAMIYINDPAGINGNILLNLPVDSLSATVSRMSMALICILTYPLTLLPPSQILEQTAIRYLLKLGFSEKFVYEQLDIEEFLLEEEKKIEYAEDGIELRKRGRSRSLSMDAFPPPIVINNKISEPSTEVRCGCRLILVLLTTFCAAEVPCFSLIISLLGCFTISLLTFVFPLLVQVRLISYPLYLDIVKKQEEEAAEELQRHQHELMQRQEMPLVQAKQPTSVSYLYRMPAALYSGYLIDMVLLVLGIVICILGTVMSAKQILDTLSKS